MSDVMIHANKACPGKWYLVDGKSLLLCVACINDADIRFVDDRLLWRHLLGDHYVKPLPDCTGWDWKPTPTYADLHDASDIEVRDWVRVIGNKQPPDFPYVWESEKYDFIGKAGRVMSSNREHGYAVSIGGRNRSFACTSLEKIKMYAELHEASDIEVGDHVRVICESSPLDYFYPAFASDARKSLIGNCVFTVVDSCRRSGFAVLAEGTRWWFPCTSLEKYVPQYRPFRDKTEAKVCRGRYYSKRGAATDSLVTEIGDNHINGMTFDDFFRNNVFDDGTPCGIKVTP
jgi:hypothetical protein